LNTDNIQHIHTAVKYTYIITSNSYFSMAI